MQITRNAAIKLALFLALFCGTLAHAAEQKKCVWGFESIVKGKNYADLDPSDRMIVENTFRKILENPKYRPSVSEEEKLRQFDGVFEGVTEFRKLASDRKTRAQMHRAISKGGTAALIAYIGYLGYPTLKNRLDQYFQTEERLNEKYGLALKGNGKRDLFFLERILRCSSPRWSRISFKGKPGADKLSAADVIETYLIEKKADNTVGSGAFAEAYRLWRDTNTVLCFAGETHGALPRADIEKFRKLADQFTPEFLHFLGIRSFGVAAPDVNLKEYDIVTDNEQKRANPLSGLVRAEDAFEAAGGLETMFVGIESNPAIQESGLLDKIDFDKIRYEMEHPEHLKESAVGQAAQGAQLYRENFRARAKSDAETHTPPTKLTQPEPEPPSKFKVKHVRGRLLLPPAGTEPPKGFRWGDEREWLIKKGIALAMLKNPAYLDKNAALLIQWKFYIEDQARFIGDARRMAQMDKADLISNPRFQKLKRGLGGDLLGKESVGLSDVTGLVSDVKNDLWKEKYAPKLIDISKRYGLFFPTTLGHYHPIEYVTDLWACHWTPKCEEAWLQHNSRRQEVVDKAQEAVLAQSYGLSNKPVRRDIKLEYNTSKEALRTVTEGDERRINVRAAIRTMDGVKKTFETFKEMAP